MRAAKPDLCDFTLPQLTSFAEDLGLSAYRARQIFSWLYRPGVTDFSQMTDLAKDLRARLPELASFSRLQPKAVEASRDGTRKYAFSLADGAVIESVLIPEEDRLTLCVSSQAGCAMGCRFCLTGTMGFLRNLRPAEIVNQVYAVNGELFIRGARLSNLVFMGMGEPLANLENLLPALEILMDQRGLDFSSRRITVSTCGLVPKMRELGEKAGVNLAVSLHSVRDEIRSELMPINRTYDIEALLAACRDYPLAKRRRIMFEYTLIAGLNDSDADARLLARKLAGIRCKINLLPCNEDPGLPFRRPPEERIAAFQQILWNAGYTVLLRASRGADISAACGQLAGKVNTEREREGRG
ncbi:MAG: 23S rRNA (adenine(2503)-C(2))-methyltransferase RlmN [Deltaproteobacteria bacterium]